MQTCAWIPATLSSSHHSQRPSTCSIASVLLGTRIRAPLLSTQRVSAPFRAPVHSLNKSSRSRNGIEWSTDLLRSVDYLLMLEMGTCCCENERGTQPTPTGQHALAISTFLCHGQQLPRIRKWARLQLPNGQMAHSSWRDKLKPLEKTRMSRNVKVYFEMLACCSWLF